MSSDSNHTCGGMRQVSKEEWDAMVAEIAAKKQARAEAMPTEQDAINRMFEARERLLELGWRDAKYRPRNGRALKLIEAGSTGIHDGHSDGEFTWIFDANDLWPSEPILFKEAILNTEGEAG